MYKDKSANEKQMYREVLISLRRITQAIDLHSKRLIREYGITGPQLVILEEVSNHDEISVSELARAISLSQATVTGILLRLEKGGLLTRKRSEKDKRRVMISVTEKCASLLSTAPPPLQETFMDEFSDLKNWEQSMILSSLQRMVSMMEARKIEAAPILATGPIVEEEHAGQAGSCAS